MNKGWGDGSMYERPAVQCCKGWAWMAAAWDLCSGEVESQSLGLAGYRDE